MPSLGNQMAQKDLFLVPPNLGEIDSDGIRHNVPNARYEKWEINSLGFRGKEINLEKKEGQIRIVCLGTSETFGVYESKDKEWPSQLGEMLKDRSAGMEVVNASVLGLKLLEKKDYVGKYVLPLKPDIMILVQAPWSYIRNSIRGVEKKHSVNRAKEEKTKRPIKVLRPKSRALRKLDTTITRYLPERLLIDIRLWKLRGRIRRKEKKYLKNKKPLDAVPENIILGFEKDLKSFILYLRENNIIPVLSTYPILASPFNKDSHKDRLFSTRRFIVELSEDGLIDAIMKSNHAMRRIAEEEDLPFIDSDNLIPKMLEYFVDFSHYTDKGADLMAKNFCHILNHFNLIK